VTDLDSPLVEDSDISWPAQIARIRAEYEARIAELEAELARLRCEPHIAGALRAKVQELETELRSGSFYKESDIDALFARAEAAEAALKSVAAPDPLDDLRVQALVEAGNRMIDFHNGPAAAKRPDIWQRLLQHFANALAAIGKNKNL
jgi:hypothetical protein